MSKIPEGYTSITPYITFDDTAGAIELYKKALGAEVIMSMPAPDGKIMHAEIKVGNARIMVGSPCPENGGKSAKTLGGSPVSFYVYVEDVQAAFDKAKGEGMTEKKAPEDMFWGDRMGTVSDPFGIDWTIAEHVRDVSPEEIEEAMKKMAC
ncbi:MAG: VOC family protein [Alphaproteobacteria bacterium]|nr:VOC family protein [Alphaproteobacteria bacterium]